MQVEPCLVVSSSIYIPSVSQEHLQRRWLDLVFSWGKMVIDKVCDAIDKD